MNDPESLRNLKELAFHFIKANHYRTIHVDGAVGGPTPQGLINICLYSERMPIPQLSVHPVDVASETSQATKFKLGPIDPGKSVVKEGIIRELEVSAFFSQEAAVQFHSWLGQMLKGIGAIND